MEISSRPTQQLAEPYKRTQKKSIPARFVTLLGACCESSAGGKCEVSRLAHFFFTAIPVGHKICSRELKLILSCFNDEICLLLLRLIVSENTKARDPFSDSQVGRRRLRSKHT